MYVRLLACCGLVAGCFNLPQWEGEVVTHPLERTAIAQCGTGAFTAEGERRITRAPYLQSTTTAGAAIVWGTKDSSGGRVEIREPGGDVKVMSDAKSVGPDLVAAVFSTLEPTHLYCYQLYDGDAALTEPAPLATAAAPGLTDPIRFVVVGDSGNASPAQKAIGKRMGEVAFDFVLFLGDIAYKDGTPKQLENNFFAIYRDILRYVPAYPSIGNHERHTRKGQPYFDAFYLPKPERYYSFDWGDVHFVAIDTTQRDREQLGWLAADLAATKQRWKIVFGHHPMYTSGLRSASAVATRRAFAKIITDNKVDLVLNGHEHQYERFRVANVNYIVSGGGGARLMPFWGNAGALRQAAVHHFLSFEVTADTLEMKAIDIDGREIDKLSLAKDKLQGPQSPVAPEKQIKPDEKIHDGPDDDENKPRLPEQKPPVKDQQPIGPTGQR